MHIRRHSAAPAAVSTALRELHRYAQAEGTRAQAHLRVAMQLLWPQLYAGQAAPGVPRWRDDLDLFTWAWCHYRHIEVIGHASAAKTHTFAHIAAAAYIADPLNTIVTLTSTHLGGLRKRLWADTVAAIRTAQIEPDILGAAAYDVRSHDMTIRPAGSREDKYLIEGIATDRGHAAVEKIQGTHSSQRRYVIIDEAQGTPGAIFEATSNLMTDPDFRKVALANPTRRHSEFGSWCEPRAGWHAIDPERDNHWETRRGGICLRLDGLRSANIKAGKTHFPFLLRQDYLDSVATAFGEGSPRWWTFVRGWFAPEGLYGTVYPGAVLNRAEPLHTYALPPVRLAALDPAFEGGDQCTLAIAEYGESRGSRWALNLVAIHPLKLAVTERSDPLDYLIAREVIRLCRLHRVAPENFILDTTGAGRGVAAILEKEWSRQLHRCGFGGAPTDRRIKTADTDTARDIVDRFVSELWWAGRAFMEEGLVGGLSSQFQTLRAQLAAREYETLKEKKISIETKRAMKERLGHSPDEADAFVMLIELLRRKGATAGPRPQPSRPQPPARPGLGRATLDSADPAARLALRTSRLVDPAREYSHGDT